MYVCARLSSASSRDTPVSMHQDLKVPRNPWTVASVPVWRRSRRKAASSICVPRAERNTSPVLPHRARAFASTATPASASGTR